MWIKSKKKKDIDNSIAILDSEDLRKYTEQCRILADQSKLVSMLQLSVNTTVATFRMKYELDESFEIDPDTGKVYTHKESE